MTLFLLYTTYKIEKINLTYKRLKKRLYIIPEQTSKPINPKHAFLRGS